MHQCKICNNNQHNNYHIASEKMFAVGEKFLYMECSYCGCVQLLNPPSDMSAYYGDGYYSFNANESYVTDASIASNLKRALKKQIVKHQYVARNVKGAAIAPFAAKTFPWLKKGIANFNSKILDIGCGSGRLLLNMRYNGFTNLHGADPFIKDDIHYKCGVNIIKKYTHELEPAYDVIMMHHSFEHVDNPLQVLKDNSRILEDNGWLIIAIPVAGCYAWRKYGVNWVQLDAPRHFFLHTTQSMQIIAEAAGYTLEDVIYDSTEFQFIGSERYLRNRTLYDESLSFTAQQIKAFKKRAEELNAVNDGDAAVYYLRKKL